MVMRNVLSGVAAITHDQSQQVMAEIDGNSQKIIDYVITIQRRWRGKLASDAYILMAHHRKLKETFKQAVNQQVWAQTVRPAAESRLYSQTVITILHLHGLRYDHELSPGNVYLVACFWSRLLAPLMSNR